jgi:hypothetical protein
MYGNNYVLPFLELQDKKELCDETEENKNPLLVVRLVFTPETQQHRLTDFSQGYVPLQLKSANIHWNDKDKGKNNSRKYDINVMEHTI